MTRGKFIWKLIGVIILIFIGYIIFSWLKGGELGFISDKANFFKNINIDSSQNKANIQTCEEKAKELIPKELTLTDNIYGAQWGFMPNANDWGDRVPMSSEGMIGFRQGSTQGENINYFYLINDAILGKYVYYSKSIINKEGLILGNNEFAVTFVLKPIPNTTESFNYGIYHRMNFEIVEVKFINCKWTE